MTEQEIDDAIFTLYHRFREDLPLRANHEERKNLVGKIMEEVRREWEAPAGEVRLIAGRLIRIDCIDESLPLWLQQLLVTARSCRTTHHALCDAAEELTSIDEPLPLWLQKYVVGLARDAGGAHRKRGRPATVGKAARDVAIVMAVDFVARRYNLRATRNVASRDTECGCSIVAKALKEFDAENRRTYGDCVDRHGVSEAGIAEVWNRINRGPRIFPSAKTEA